MSGICLYTVSFRERRGLSSDTCGLPMKEGSLEEICRDIDEEEALWIRGEFFNSPVIPPYYIIFGHTRPVRCCGTPIRCLLISRRDAANSGWSSGITESALTAERHMAKIWDA